MNGKIIFRSALGGTVLVGILGGLAVSCAATRPAKNPQSTPPATGGSGSSEPTTAPAAFDNATNGFEPQDAFVKDRCSFETVENIEKDGLGPGYNERACGNCHSNPVTGSSSQINEIRAGFIVRRAKAVGGGATRPAEGGAPFNRSGYDFVEPTGGSLIHQRTIDAAAQEEVPGPDPRDPSRIPVRALRMTTNILGNGFVELIPDQDILSYQEEQERQHRSLKGLAISVSVSLVDPANPGDFLPVLRVGRFGWKCQDASLINFSAGAYINEMGITNPLHPKENASNGRDVTKFDPTPEPPLEDPVDPAGKYPFGGDVEAFARFMRSTKAPPEGTHSPTDPTYDLDPAQVDNGRRLFGTNKTDQLIEIEGTKYWRTRIADAGIGCVVCHRVTFTTPPSQTKITSFLGGDASDLPNSVVPESLGNKVFEPYSDFMLHDIGTGDGIVQTQFAQNPARGAEKTTADTRAKLNQALKQAQSKYRIAVTVRETADESDRPASNSKVGRRLVERDSNGDDAPLDQRTRNRVRTAPLWGLHVRNQLLHDGSALTIDLAIRRHKGEATAVSEAYEALSDDDRRDLLAFLNSLGFGGRTPGSAPPCTKPD